MSLRHCQDSFSKFSSAITQYIRLPSFFSVGQDFVQLFIMVVANYVQTEEYDIVIAGGMTFASHQAPSKIIDLALGGTTACVIAGRLAKDNPSLSILIIEEGKDNYNDPTIRNPVAFLSHLAPGSKTVKFYRAKPSAEVEGREIVLPAGSVLGGGSSVNFMLYTRAQGIDFDSWQTEGWYQADMMPLLKRVRSNSSGVVNAFNQIYSSKTTTAILLTPIVRSMDMMALFISPKAIAGRRLKMSG